MNNLQNSASLRYNTFASLNSRGRVQEQTKPQGPLATMTASDTTQSRSIASILMVVGHQRIGRKFLGQLRKKEIREVSIRDPPSIAREAAHGIVAMVTAEAPLDLHIVPSHQRLPHIPRV
jgi:hypothetical protein